MTQHSLLGASSAYRWLQCPGSFKLSQTAPHRPASIYAATGSMAHDFIDRKISFPKTHEQVEACLGRTINWDGHDILVDQDFVDGINVMVNYLLEATLFNSWYKIEFQVSLDEYIAAPPVPLFGTVDAGIWDLGIKTLEIVDYKNGAGVIVSPVENPQLLYYAAGVLAQLPEHWRKLVERLKLTIVQPHARSVAPIRSWEISVVDLLMWVDEVLVPGVEACAQPDAPLNPGSWCRFCPVSHACPRLQQDAVAMAQREFDDAAALKPIPDQLAHSLDIAERAQLWIDRVREHAVEQLKHQVPIPGWGLVPTRPTRKWIDPDSKTAAELSRTGLSHDEIWETRLRSPAQVEKACGRFIWDQVAPLVEAKSSGVKLARTGTSAREDFADDE